MEHLSELLYMYSFVLKIVYHIHLKRTSQSASHATKDKSHCNILLRIIFNMCKECRPLPRFASKNELSLYDYFAAVFSYSTTVLPVKLANLITLSIFILKDFFKTPRPMSPKLLISGGMFITVLFRHIYSSPI